MIKSICSLLALDDASNVCFEDTYKKICNSDEAMEILEDTKEKMFSGVSDFKEALPQIAYLSGTDRYASDMVFWLLCAEPLRELYKKEGFSDEFSIDALKD